MVKIFVRFHVTLYRRSGNCLKLREHFRIVPRLIFVWGSPPSPNPLPEGEGALLEPLFESPLPAGEGQGEGHSCHGFRPTLNFEMVSPAEAGIQSFQYVLDSSLRQCDDHERSLLLAMAMDDFFAS